MKIFSYVDDVYAYEVELFWREENIQRVLDCSVSRLLLKYLQYLGDRPRLLDFDRLRDRCGEDELDEEDPDKNEDVYFP